MKRYRLALAVYWAVTLWAVLMLTMWAGRVCFGATADCHDATCRITTADGSRGTGCVFEVGEQHVYVLTAAHVVADRSTVECEFWREGHLSTPLVGRVVARSEEADAAIVHLDASSFGGLPPRAVPIAPRDEVLRPGDTVVSVGCAQGAWSTGFQGHVLRHGRSDIVFVPPPANGRSGSAIFDARGEKIVGLLRARAGDDSHGIATSVQALYEAFDVPTQCGPEGCPSTVPSVPYHLSPYRQNQSQRDGVQNGRIGRLENVWPTLPQYAPQYDPRYAPTVPPTIVDLGETNGKIDGLTDKIDELIDTLRSREEPPPESPPMERGSPGTMSLQTEVDATRQETGKLREAVNVLIGDRETLRERFEERIAKVKEELGEDASRREVAQAYVKDLAAEKLSGGAGWTIGKLLAGGLGMSGPLAFAVGGGLWLVSRRIGRKLEAGEPLLVERLFDRIGGKLDDLKDRLDGDRSTTSNRKSSR